MKLYGFQRSCSFIDLGPRSLRFKIFKRLSLKCARPIEAKFHVEPPGDWGTKVNTNGPGDMTNMVTMPINGKNLKKSSSGNKRPMTMKVGMQYWVLDTTIFVQVMTLG